MRESAVYSFINKNIPRRFNSHINIYVKNNAAAFNGLIDKKAAANITAVAINLTASPV